MLVKIIINQAILLVFQIVIYFGCEKFQKNFHNVKFPVDDHIPFIPASVLPYCLWFPLITIFPIRLYFADQLSYRIYMIAMISEIILSVICYMLYPTTFERPVPPDTVFGRLMALVYKGSYRGVNCAPSLHCSSCYLILYMSVKCTGMPLIVRVITGIVCVSIVISTMTTKQHTLIDALSALPVCVICVLIGTFIA